MLTRVASRLTLSLLAGCGLALPLVYSTTTARAQNTLVTGKKITLPAIGHTTNVGSLPMNLALSPNGSFAVSTNMGYREYLCVISTTTGALVSQLDYNAGLDGGAGYPTQGLYYGLVFNPTLNGDGTYTLYASVETSIDASGNYSYGIEKLSLNATTGQLTHGPQVNLQTGDFPASLALDARGNLYVALNEYFLNGSDSNDLLTLGRVAVLDAATLVETGRVALSATPLSNFPLSVAALADGSKVYVSSQRDAGVYVINASNPAAPTVAGYVATGAHPDALLLNRAQSLLYVANAHSDTVSVIHTADNSTAATISLRPIGATALAGVSPTSLALSADEKTLYAALGDMNAVAVIDLTRNAVTGYIPAGWYPTGVVNVNSNLLISNAKGHQTRYTNPTYQQYSFANAYDLNLIEGDVQTLPVPTGIGLLDDTLKVLSNNQITLHTGTLANNPLAGIGLQAGKITHVIYVIKENRTFDQVLGDTDVPGANGDPTRTLFGQQVTPNLHFLVKRFALLDNFYDCGEASGDGWPWSTQSFATEYVIKNLPFNYSSRGRNYDFEGQNNGYPVGGFGPGLSVAFPAGAPPIPDVSEAPAHHIWDLARAAGLTYRNYGCFSTFGVSIPGLGTLIPDNYPTSTGLQPGGHYTGGPLNPAQAGYTDLDFRRFDTTYADSDAYADAGAPIALQTYGQFNAQSRFSERTMELLLGLPPMSQYDAIASPMTALFDTAPNNSAVYTLLPYNSAIIGSRTAFKPKDSRYRLVQLSGKMDFVHPDSADPRLLNEILWKGLKGMNSKLPAPKHSPILTRLSGKSTRPAKSAGVVRDSDD
jgi:YVTN family beta-propeller protein